MFRKLSQTLNESASTITKSVSSSETVGDQTPYSFEGEVLHLEDNIAEETEFKKSITVGDSLPYGPRMYYETNDNVVRMKDIGEKNRILLLGVLGSFTPYCWNRHLFRVLKKLKYYKERGVDYICCISTNDAYTQRAWAEYLGCEESVLMWADATTKFTQAMGMEVVIPWLDNRIRSRRYLILAEDMVVTKMVAAPCDNKNMTWQCEHLTQEVEEEDEESEESWL